MLATQEQSVASGPAAGFVPVLDTRPLGSLVDELFELRDGYQQTAKQLEEEKKVFKQKEEALISRLKAEGLDGARGSKASISLTPSIVPNVENWDEFYKFIRRNNAFHMLERRPSAGAYRELMTQRTKPVPGVVPFEVEKLSLRTV